MGFSAKGIDEADQKAEESGDDGFRYHAANDGGALDSPERSRRFNESSRSGSLMSPTGETTTRKLQTIRLRKVDDEED